MCIAVYFFTLIHCLPWFISSSLIFFTIFLNVRKAVNIKVSSSWSFFNNNKYFVFVFSTVSTTSIMLKLFFCIIKLRFCAGSKISINKNDCTSTDVSTSFSHFPLTVARSHFFDVSAMTVDVAVVLLQMLCINSKITDKTWHCFQLMIYPVSSCSSNRFNTLPINSINLL